MEAPEDPRVVDQGAEVPGCVEVLAGRVVGLEVAGRVEEPGEALGVGVAARAEVEGVAAVGVAEGWRQRHRALECVVAQVREHHLMGWIIEEGAA